MITVYFVKSTANNKNQNLKILFHINYVFCLTSNKFSKWSKIWKQFEICTYANNLLVFNLEVCSIKGIFKSYCIPRVNTGNNTSSTRIYIVHLYILYTVNIKYCYHVIFLSRVALVYLDNVNMIMSYLSTNKIEGFYRDV